MIFCAAEFDKLLQPPRSGDLVIAADGGLRHVQSLGIRPDIVVGDFDSLGYIPEGATVHPVEKDDTDAMLAVKLGLSRGFRRFVIYGGMDGRRIDHTVANFQMLGYLAQQGAMGILVGRDSLACAVKDGTLAFPGDCCGGISVFCAGADAAGVSIRGLYYQVEDVSLTAAFPLGVSNHFTGAPAGIRVAQGTLLVIWDRSAGLPL